MGSCDLLRVQPETAQLQNWGLSPIFSLNPDRPACASTITNRGLHKQPDRRYASAMQTALAFRRCGARRRQFQRNAG